MATNKRPFRVYMAINTINAKFRPQTEFMGITGHHISGEPRKIEHPIVRGKNAKPTRNPVKLSYNSLPNSFLVTSVVSLGESEDEEFLNPTQPLPPSPVEPKRLDLKTALKQLLSTLNPEDSTEQVFIDASVVFTKDLYLHELIQRGDWLKDQGKDWERCYSMEKACFIAERLLQAGKSALLTNEVLNAEKKSVSRLLLESIRSRPEKWYKNALFVAAASGYINLLKFLLGQLPPDGINSIRDGSGNNVLLIAAMFWKSNSILELVRFHEEKGLPRRIVDLDSVNRRGQSALILEACNGNQLSIGYLLSVLDPETQEPEVDINLQDNDGNTALMEAARRGYVEAAQILLESGADVTLANRFGETVTWLALLGKNPTLVSLILEKPEAFISYEEIAVIERHLRLRKQHKIVQFLMEKWQRDDEHYDKILNDYKRVEVHFFRIMKLRPPPTQLHDFFRAVYYGDLDAIRQLSEKPTTDYQIQTALRIAGYLGRLEIVDYFLPIDGSKDPDDDLQLLVTVAANGRAKILQLLLDRIHLPEHHYGQALIAASKYGQEEVIEILVENDVVNVNFQDHNGWSSLLYAARDGLLTTVKLLLQKPEIDCNLSNKDRVSPLMWAVKFNHLDIVEALLATGKVNLDDKNVDGTTALIYAAGNTPGGKEVEIARLLLQNGASINCATKDKKTALIKAVQRGNDNFVQLLLHEFRGVNINACDAEGRSALMWSCADGYANMVSMFLRLKAKLELEDSANGSTALHLAAEGGFSKIIEWLVATGMNINQQRSKDSYSPLMIAATKPDLQLLKKMMAYDNCDLETKDMSGNTTLMLATELGHRSIVEALLDANLGGKMRCDVNARNANGETPLMIACRVGSPLDLVKVLAKYGADLSLKDPRERVSSEIAAQYGHDEIYKFLKYGI